MNIQGLRFDLPIVVFRLLLAAATACAWMLSASLKPMLVARAETGFPAQDRAYTAARLSIASQEVQSGFSMKVLAALQQWAAVSPGLTPCGHVATSVALDDGQHIASRLVSRGCLEALRMPLVAGRFFTAEEHANGTFSQVCIASQRLMDRSGGRLALGDSIPGAGFRCVIVGIADSSVVGFSPESSPDDLWLPIESSPGLVYRQSSELDTAAMTHISLIDTDEVRRAGHVEELESLLRLSGNLERGQRILIEDGVSTDIAHVKLVDRLRSSALLIAVALFIATLGNSALLTEALLASRRHILAIRTAVGASPRRLLADVLIESSRLAVFGSVLGVLVGGLLLRLAANQTTATASTAIRLEALIAPTLIAIAATLVQLITATLMSAPRHVGILGSIMADGLVRSRAPRPIRWMVAAQLVAAAVVAMVAVTTSERFSHLLPSESGITDQPMSFVRIRDTHFSAMSDDARVTPLVDEILARLRSMPGVDAAAVSSLQPLGIDDYISRIELEGKDKSLDVRVVQVSDGYPSAVGIRVVRGSSEELSHLASGEAFVDDVLVSKLGGGPLDGVRLAWPVGASKERQFRVRGVVRRVVHSTTRGPTGNALWQPDGESSNSGGEFPTIYVRYDGFTEPTFIVRTALAPSVIARQIGTLWRQASSTGSVAFFTTSRDALDPLLARDRLIARVFAFGTSALMAIVGAAMFGTMAIALPVRRRNSAIALALGAQPIRLVTRDIVSAVTAALLACAAALPIAYAITAIMGDSVPMSPGEAAVAFPLAIAILVVVSVCAVFPLAVRIANADPQVLLRV